MNNNTYDPDLNFFLTSIRSDAKFGIIIFDPPYDFIVTK